MFADAGADVVVTNANETDSVAGIIGKAVKRNTLRQLILRDKLKGNGQVFLYETLHLTLNLLLFLTARLMVKLKRHLTLFPFDMGINGTSAAEQTDHRLVQQMFRRMCGRKLLLVMFIQKQVTHPNS